MAIIADFMLVYLPAPTVSLRPPLALSAGGLSKFFHNCPDNAFQVLFGTCWLSFEKSPSRLIIQCVCMLQIAISGTSYSLLQRFGAIAVCGVLFFLSISFYVISVTRNSLFKGR